MYLRNDLILLSLEKKRMSGGGGEEGKHIRVGE